MEKPKLIHDLGLSYATEKSSQKTRFGLYECPFCLTLFKQKKQHIKSGHTISCGCYHRKLWINLSTIHGKSRTRLFARWCGIKARCYNENNTAAKDYSGRLISMCDEWKNNFMSFYNWAILNGYKPNLQIDRINNDGNYEPTNCRWVCSTINTQNSRLIKSNNTSGYRGVTCIKRLNKWQACITNNKVRHYLGIYDSAELAAKSYNEFVINNKTFHPLNIIPCL